MKYLFCNDIKNFFRGRTLKLVIVVLILEFIFQFIIIDDNIVNLLLGRNLENVKDYISMLFFLLHVLLFMFMSLDIYLRDMLYNVDNIFFRIKPIKFIGEKIIFLIISTIVLRLLEYIVILPVLISRMESIDIIGLSLVKDILFYLLFSLIVILLREYKWLIGDKGLGLIIIFLIFVPKNIDVFYNYYLIGVFTLIVIIMLSMMCFSKKIIESEGVGK
ncbi:MAG: hypothetical protein Q4F33_01130 [Mycoplasmatota bacterium]|nr:hypothetical protein [Mycoplasmatota bacterium]